MPETPNLDSVVENYASRLLRFFLSLGADLRTAEDCTQEVFLRWMKHQERYQERGQLKAYLFQIAYRLWIDKQRQKKQDSLADPFLEGLFESLPERIDSPFESLLRKESEHRLKTMLQILSEEQRVVFELGVLEEIRYKEISEILKIPVGTVKSRMFAAVQKLRQSLNEEAFYS